MRKTVSTLASTVILVQAASPVFAVTLIPSPSEQVFVAFATPCRIFDSHATSPLANNADTNAFINLAGYNYPSQGGTNGGCNVPPSATSVAISITTSGGTSNGFVTVTPGGNPASTIQASFLPNSPETAGMSVGLRANRITLHPTGGSVQATVDINGYYAPQMQAYINSDGTIYSQTGRIVSSTLLATGQYKIVLDRDVTPCAEFITPGAANQSVYGYSNQSSAYVFVSNLSNGSFVASNGQFNFSVQC